MQTNEQVATACVCGGGTAELMLREQPAVAPQTQRVGRRIKCQRHVIPDAIPEVVIDRHGVLRAGARPAVHFEVPHVVMDVQRQISLGGGSTEHENRSAVAVGKSEKHCVVSSQGQATVVVNPGVECAIKVDELLTVNWVNRYVDISGAKVKVKVISRSIIQLMLQIQRPVRERCGQICKHINDVMQQACTTGKRCQKSVSKSIKIGKFVDSS